MFTDAREEKLDLERYGGPIKGYLKSFTLPTNPLCGLCGKRPGTREASSDQTVIGKTDISACPVCRDHILLGTGLVKEIMAGSFQQVYPKR